MHVDTESIPAEGDQAPLPVPAEKAYDKSTSFFDSISCESLDRLKDDSDGGNARSDRRRHERSLNAETFGRAANDRCASSPLSIVVLCGVLPLQLTPASQLVSYDVGGRTTAVARGATALPARTRPTAAPAQAAATSPWTTTGPPEAEVSPQLVVAMLPPSEEPPAPRRDSWYEPSSAHTDLDTRVHD